MARKFSSLLILSLLTVAFFGMAVNAAKEPAKRVVNPLIYKSLQYAFPDEHIAPSGLPHNVDQPGRTALGNAASPGVIGVVGNTWYDYQHNGTMGRMIDWGISPGGVDTLVHFSWMYLPSSDISFAREYRYDVYSITNQVYGSETGLQSDDDYAGYVGIAVTGDNRAVVGGHNKPAGGVGAGYYHPHFYFDFSPAGSFFGENHQVPPAVTGFGSVLGDTNQVIWPKFRYVEGAGANDSVLHVVAQTSEPDAGDPQAIYYFRGVRTASSVAWDAAPYIIDTIYDLSHDIAANNSGKVALIWTANLPCDALDDDTASGIGCKTFVQFDNDVYYQISTDFGVTWNNRVNLTNHRTTEGLEDSWRPYTDMSALLDEDDGELHLVWGSRFWPADANDGGQAGLIRNRIFHWSENQPFIRVAHNANWDQTVCNGGAWQLNASKMSISQCNGFHYVLFTQFNDIPAGVEDDCAAEGNPGFPSGSANGELYVAVSEDGGLTWDLARNITNTRTPGCDSASGILACKSEHWPSMARYGKNVSLAAGDVTTETVVPAGGTDDGWHLPVQYIQDQTAGGIVQDEGTWQLADVEWFMLACVDAIKQPLFSVVPTEVVYPDWTKHGVQFDQDITIENLGNQDLVLSVTAVEDNGPSGWLATTGIATTIPFGLGNTDDAIINLNAGGVVNTPGTIVNLKGRLIFTSGAPSSPDTFNIDFYVADTLYLPELDSVETSCLALGVVNNGSYGQQGIKRMGMDWVDAGDCDTNAVTYLYDGSPVIGRINGVDTVMNWSVFGVTYVDDPGFIQDVSSSGSNAFSTYYTTKFFNHDTTIAMEKTWYAPTDLDSCDFIVQSLKIYNADDADGTIAGVVIGELVDFDIPSDSGSENGSGFDAGRNLIYQYGAGYGDPACVLNDQRYGGISFLQMLKRTTTVDDGGSFYGAYTENNATFVYGNTDGLKMPEIYANMTNPDINGGYALWSSDDPDSSFTDLHTGMSYVTNYTVTPGETLVVYTALATESGQAGVPAAKSLGGLEAAMDAAKAWYCGHLSPIGCGCCVDRGNVDDLIGPGGPVDVSDLTYLVAFLFQGGDPPPCEDQGNVDSLVGPGGPIDVSDLTYLVAFLFQGGDPPPAC